MTRGRRGQPRQGGTDRFQDIQPDPSRIGGVAEAPFVRLPDPATLFDRRARRLADLAGNHPMAAYLDLLASVVTAQARCVIGCPAPRLRTSGVVEGFPPLSADHVRGNAEFAATLTWLLDHVVLDGAPESAQAALARVRAWTEPDRFAMAVDILAGSYDAGNVAESLFVAAALQVHLARLAAQVNAADVTPSALGQCPVCGGVPVSSVVVGWTQASKARYCACSLCGTLWNHVRIKCTSCEATQGIAYYTIEDAPKTIGIEACSTCHSYIKHMQQHEDPVLDPMADDVASYALDLLARDAGFHRSGINPLFLIP